MKNFILFKWFSNRTITVKVIIVFVASMVLALTISVGRSIWSYQSYNQDVAQRQSAFSLEAIDERLEVQRESSLNYVLQLSKTAGIINALEVNSSGYLKSVVQDYAAYTDLDFVIVTDLAGNVIHQTDSYDQFSGDMSGEKIIQSALAGKRKWGSRQRRIINSFFGPAFRSGVLPVRCWARFRVGTR